MLESMGRSISSLWRRFKTRYSESPWDATVSVMAVLSFVGVLVQGGYTLYTNRSVEQATLSVIRWSAPRQLTGSLDVHIWLAVSNTGNKSMVVTQSPISIRSVNDPKGAVLLDTAALAEQQKPILIESGKQGTLSTSVTITREQQRELMIPAARDGQRADDGRTHVIQMVVDVIALNPSGQITEAVSKCIRIPFKDRDMLDMNADHRTTPFTPRFESVDSMKLAPPRLFPCDA
jgi:hypothetical protein